MPLKAILWDNDGVLSDTERLFYTVNRDYFRSLGVELSERDFYDCFLADSRGAWHRLDCSPSEIAIHRDERNRLYLERLMSGDDWITPGMGDVIAALPMSLRMGVVTSASRTHFDAIHRNSGLLDRFEFVLAEGDYARPKPAPDPYLTGLSRLGLPPEACVAIEDSPRGVEAAVAAGLQVIAIRTSLSQWAEFSGAWRVVDRPSEVGAILAAMYTSAA